MFDSLELPSHNTTPSEQKAIWALFEKVCLGLKELTNGDFNNQFVCIEMFIFSDTHVEVMEVNIRVSANQLPAFHRVSDGGCPFAAQALL